MTKKLHTDLIEYKLCGEWFKSNTVDKILENKAKEEAIQTRTRL
jgi:hypothetical protein